MVDVTRMLTQLERHEGLRRTLYADTKGIDTIGIGFNVRARGVAHLSAVLRRPVTLDSLRTDGITVEEARLLARLDIADVEAQLIKTFGAYARLDEVRQRVCVDFVFNVGLAGARKFRQAVRWLTLAVDQAGPDLREACFTAAAFHLMDSLYARDVGDGLGGRWDRADRLCTMLRTGQDWTR